MGAGEVNGQALGGVLLSRGRGNLLIFMKWQIPRGILLFLVGELAVMVRKVRPLLHAQACRWGVPYSFGVAGLKFYCTFAAQ